MSNQDIIRAWKDEDYRLSLSEAERAVLPEHPAGLIELAGAEIDGVAGEAGGIQQVYTNTVIHWICRGGPPPE